MGRPFSVPDIWNRVFDDTKDRIKVVLPLAGIVLTVSEIQIGAVELDDGDGGTRASIKDDGVAISTSPNGGGLMMSGRNGTDQKHIRTNPAGEIIVEINGISGLNVLTGATPSSLVATTVSQVLAAANPNRKYFSVSLVSDGERFSLGLDGHAAEIDKGDTYFLGSKHIFDSSAMTLGPIELVADQDGARISFQEG